MRGLEAKVNHDHDESLPGASCTSWNRHLGMARAIASKSGPVLQMQTESEARQAEVDELLRKCTDAKLLLGGTGAAIEHAERAYELANTDPALPAPWPQLAAYRLAHLILRQNPTEELLYEANELFEKASGGTSDNAPLGPMPRLYWLAVLHRLSLPGDTPRPAVPRAC